MNHLLSATGIAIAALAASAFPGAPAPAAPPPADHPYIAFGCAQCHGTVGQGSMTAPPLPRGYPYEALIAKLRSPGQRMERYSEEALPDADVRRIADYLASVPEDPPVERIPLLAR